MKEKQPTNRDLANSLQDLANTLDVIVESIVVFANDTQKRFDAIDGSFRNADSRFGRVESRLDRIESTMVTKDFLEDKLGALRGDLVVMTRKEDKKLLALVDVLHRKKVLTRSEANGIAQMDPFATLSLT